MNNNKGFSLLEVLITLLLTTVGILGMVALQSKGIQYTQDAGNRNAAVELANDLVEIMRSHRDDLYINIPPATYSYSELRNATPVYAANGSLAMDISKCPAASLPQTLEQAAGCWFKKVTETLPGTTTSEVKDKFRVCPSYKAGECAGAAYKGSSLEVVIAWGVNAGECMDGSESGSVCTYSARLEL